MSGSAESNGSLFVYVTTQGAYIVREERQLLVKKGNDTYHTLFVYKLENRSLWDREPVFFIA